MDETQTQGSGQAEDRQRDPAILLKAGPVMDILEHMSDALYIVNEDWRITYVNRKTEEYWGRRREDMLGHSIWSAFPQASAAAPYHEFLCAMKERRSVTFEYFSAFVNRWLDVRAYPTGAELVIYLSDITARKQAELERERLLTELSKSRHLFQQIAETSPDALYVFDLAAERFVYISPRSEQVIGYTADELLALDGRATAALWHPDDLLNRALHMRRLQELADGEIYEYDNRTRQPDATYRWLSSRSTVLTRAADGQIEQIVGVTQNITRRKTAEAAEREQRRFAEALRDSLAVLTGSFAVERVMQQILDSAAIVVPSEAGCIILFEGNFGHIAYLRGFSSEAEAFFKDYQFPTLLSNGDPVLSDKQAYFVPDTHADPTWIVLPVSEWVRSSIGMPIEIRGTVIGLLVVDSITPNHFKAADMEKLQAFARYASLALENAQHVTQLEQKVAARTAELNDAKERVEAILNNSLDGILLVYPDLHIQQTNAAFHRLFAYEPADAYYGSLYDLIHTDDVPRVHAIIETALREQVGQQVEIRCYRKNGTLFEVELSLSYMAAMSGTARLVCTLRDITERKQAQAALAEERNLLRTLIDTIPDYIYIKDTDHRSRLSNIARARSVGMTPEEIVGKDDFALFPVELATQFKANEDRLFQSGLPLIDHEERIIGPDGNLIWGSTTKVPLRNLHGELIGLVGITRDISEQKQRERQLRYYASLQENVNDAVIATDMAFLIQSWNRAAEMIYGWRAEEAIGKRVPEFLPSRYLSDEENDAHAHQALLEQGHWQGEIVQHCKDGSELYILSSVTLLKDEQGLPLGVVGVNRNITERRQADEALREQRDFLQLVINSVPDLITVNDRTGHFQMVNEHAAQIYGLTPADMVGKTDAEVNHNLGEVAFFLETDQATLDSEQTVFIPEQTIQGRYYQTSKIPLKNPTGQPDRLLAVSSDITQRKQAESALQQALQKEKELGELKSRFFSMASHEFRTPLTSILLLTETLYAYQHNLTGDQIEQRLGKIQAQVYHLKDVMEDVLQLAQLEARRVAFTPGWFDLDALCRSILDEFQSQSASIHRLSYTCDDALKAVNLDKKLIRQLITNLLSNAIKYSTANTIVKVSLTQTDEALVFQVQDEGIGIPAADLSYLFEPFHRAANVGKIAGTGLGLTIAKEAAELHGGTLMVESQSGVGTTFTARIPLMPSAE